MKILFSRMLRGVVPGDGRGRNIQFLVEEAGDERGGEESLWRDLQGNAPLTESKQAQGEISTH